MYKVINGRHGQRYLKDGRFIKTADVPPDIRIKLDVGMNNLSEEEPETKKTCAICGGFGRFPKSLNGQAILLCEDDYYNNTTGKIVQLIREKSNAI